MNLHVYQGLYNFIGSRLITSYVWFQNTVWYDCYIKIVIYEWYYILAWLSGYNLAWISGNEIYLVAMQQNKNEMMQVTELGTSTSNK